MHIVREADVDDAIPLTGLIREFVMKRAKIGDVYYVKVPNGYKLYQWAYNIPKIGAYIRVFDGLYSSLPNNVAEIAAGPHSYIISFYSSRAYRIGLANLLGNFPVPKEYPFPEYMFSFHWCEGEAAYWVWITRTDVTNSKKFYVRTMEELPEEFRALKLLSNVLSPAWILYLFDIDWNLEKLSSFYPGKPGEDFEAILQEYIAIVDEALARDKEKRMRKRKKSI